MSRHEVHGPRIIVKDDRDSSVGRGCVLFAAHFRQGLSDIPRLAATCAPFSTQEVWLTEGWREIRPSRDMHKELCAFDITFRMPGGVRANKGEYDQAASRMRIFLGRDYDIVVHGSGANEHIHIEWDRKD